MNSTPPDLEPLPADKPGNTAQRQRVMLANHERANRFVLAADKAVVRDGRFEVKLPLPDKLPWPRLILRAYAATDTEEGIGVRWLDVKAPARKTP